MMVQGSWRKIDNMLNGDDQASEIGLDMHTRDLISSAPLALWSSSEKRLDSSIADALCSSFKVENFIEGFPPSSLEAVFGPSRRYLHRISHFPPFLHD